MTVGYVIRYKGYNEDEFDGIYLDVQEAKNFQHTNDLGLSEILEANFVQCQPEMNKAFYMFQRRPFSAIMFGLYDDTWVFDAMIKEIIDLQNKVVPLLKAAGSSYYEDPEIKNIYETRRRIMFEHVIMSVQPNKNREGRANLLSRAGLKIFERQSYHTIELKIKNAQDREPLTEIRNRIRIIVG